MCNFIGKIFYWRNFIQSDQNVPVPNEAHLVIIQNLTPVFDSTPQRRRRWICRQLWRASRPSRERFSSRSTTARSSTSPTAKTSTWRSLSWPRWHKKVGKRLVLPLYCHFNVNIQRNPHSNSSHGQGRTVCQTKKENVMKIVLYVLKVWFEFGLWSNCDDVLMYSFDLVFISPNTTQSLVQI